MKHFYAILYTTFMLVCSVSVQAQVNMVPNGDFEAYTTCPTNVSQMAGCTGWRQYHGGTSDYYNACASVSNNVHVPLNLVGYQYAASGNAYAGFYTYNGVVDYKEYIARPITALTVGAMYEVSVSVSLADKSSYVTNDLGVWFYHNGAATTITNNSNALTVQPQISYRSYGAIADTAHWVRLTAVFIADSAYDNIVIGGFGASSGIIAVSSSGAATPYAYYFIDSVVVKKANLGFNLTDTAYCAGDTLVLPFSAYPGRYSSANVFSLQLSDVSGSFTNATTIATAYGGAGSTFRWVVPSNITPGAGYRLRIMATDVTDSSDQSRTITIGNVKPSRPLAWNDVPLCEGDTLKLHGTCNTSGVSYTWRGPASFSSNRQHPSRAPVITAYSGNYILTAWQYGCSANDTLPVHVVPTTGIIGIANLPQACTNDTLKLSATSLAPGTTFRWTGPGGYVSYAQDTIIPHPDVTMTGSYILTGYYSGCSSSYNVGVSVLPSPDSFFAKHNYPLCKGDTLRLSAYCNTPGVVFQWTGPNGFSSMAASPYIKKATDTLNGKYICIASLGNCTAIDTVDVQVTELSNVIFTNSNSPVCQNGELQLFGSSASKDTTTYQWKGPNGFTANTADAKIKGPALSASGAYILTGHYAGCSSSDTTYVVIKEAPLIKVITGIITLCEGEDLNLFADVYPPGTTLKWNGPAGYTYDKDSIHIPGVTTANAGTYFLQADLDGCTDNSAIDVSVFAYPEIPLLSTNAPVTEGDMLRLYINNASAGTSYGWSGPNAFMSAVTAPVINAVTKANAGWYVAWAYNDRCGVSDSILVVINDKPAKDTSYLVVYPNANNGNFTVAATVDNDQQVHMTLSASNGQIVYRTMVNTHDKLLKTDIQLKNALSTGIYTLRLRLDGRIYYVQVLVKR